MLSAREPDGRTHREHLLAGKAYAELDDAPDCPWHLRYLLGWYQEISGSRQSGMAANPLTFEEIHRWAQLMKKRPAPWEVRVIKLLDNTLMTHIASQDAKKAAKK